MKTKRKRKWISFAVLILAVIAIVEFQKYMKRQAAACAGGTCAIPAEMAGAVVGPQNVPISVFTNDPPQTEALPRLIDFGRGTCATCKMMNAVLRDLAGEYSNQLIVQLVDTSENKALTEKYGIRMIPTQIFLDTDGNELFRHEGFISKDDILKKWNELGVDL